MKIVKAIFLSVMLVGSQTVSAAVPVFSTSAESKYARELAPPKGKAIIYIYQRSQDGTGVSPTIWLNNYEIGRIVPGSFSVWQLAPGRLELRIGGADPATLSLRSQAGKIYLFRLSVTQTGAGPKAQMESLPESYRTDMAETQLLKNPRQLTAVVSQAPAKQAPAKPVAPPVAETSTASQPAKSSIAARPSPRQSLEPGGFSMTLKTGTVTLSQDTQSVLGVDSSFKKNASGTYAVDVDYQFEDGLTAGGELLSYKTEFTQSGSTNDIGVRILLGTTKQYFYTDSRLQPFVGAGIGAAITDVSGSIVGNTAGVAYQLMVGVEYRFDNIGVRGEFNYLSAKTKSSNDQTIDVSGTAILAGIVFHF